MNLPVRTIRLASHPQENGLWCGPEGLTLAGRPLLERTKSGFAPAGVSEIQKALDHSFGETGRYDASIYLPGLASIARSLNKGDMPLAMIGSVLLKLPEIPQFNVADTKWAYDDSEARDGLGRWTDGGVAEAEGITTADAAATSEAVAELAPATVGLLARLAGILSGPVALAAATLIPTNKSNIHYGRFPDFPGLYYRSDEGIVRITRLDTAGNIELLYQGAPDANGFYRDKEGLIIGRHVGNGVMFDNDSLADFAAEPSTAPGEDRVDPPAATKDDESACPAPTPENINGRSNRSLAYQEQITGLPRGLDVNYLGVRFDGCDDDTGRMIEAKGLGMEWMLQWPKDDFYQSKFYVRMMRQAGRQNYASEGRGDDYYFAAKPMANFFGIEFRKAGYANITVHQVDAIVKKMAVCPSAFRIRHSSIH